MAESRSRVQRPRRQRHACNICHRSFGKGEHLARHSRIHTQEKPYQCSVCHHSYARRDTLKRHVSTHNSSTTGDASKENNCTIIDGAISSSTGVADGLNLQHDPEPYGSAEQPQYITSNPPTTVSFDAFGVGPNADSLPDLSPDGLSLSDLDWFGASTFELSQSFDLQLELDQSAGLSTWPLLQPSTGTPIYDTAADQLRPPPTPRPSLHHEPVTAKKVQWFDDTDPVTRVAAQHRETASSTPRHSSDDDTWLSGRDRTAVEQRLSQYPRPDTLPSTAFLNRCIRLCLDKALPLMPVVHLPSFRARSANVFLIVAAAALGSQLIGTNEAALQGLDLYERMHSALLASWMSIADRSQETLDTMQSVVLGRFFAMLSPRRNHLVAAQAFHGTLIHSFRRLKRTLGRQQVPAAAHTQPVTAAELERTWHAWIDEQRLLRVEVGIRILDVELSLLCHQPPLMAPDTDAGAALEPDTLFYARSAKKWKHAHGSLESRRSRNELPGPGALTSTLAEYAHLSSLLALICAFRTGHSHHSKSRATIEFDLARWLVDKTPLLKNQARVKDLHLQVLWHSGWLAMLCDLVTVELACGKEGDEAAGPAQAALASWACTLDARRALVHAFKVRQLLADIFVSQVPALHVPRAAFHAGLIFHALAAFAPHGTTFFAGGHDTESLSGLPDIQALESSGNLTAKDWNAMRRSFESPEQLKGEVCTVIGILRRVGPWGISYNLAQTLEMLATEQNT